MGKYDALMRMVGETVFSSAILYSPLPLKKDTQSIKAGTTLSRKARSVLIDLYSWGDQTGTKFESLKLMAILEMSKPRFNKVIAELEAADLIIYHGDSGSEDGYTVTWRPVPERDHLYGVFYPLYVQRCHDKNLLPREEVLRIFNEWYDAHPEIAGQLDHFLAEVSKRIKGTQPSSDETDPLVIAGFVAG